MPRKKQAPQTPNPSSTAILALSELHFRAEALEKEHQWLLKQIKRKRTELNNFVEQMRSVATEIFHRGTPAFKKLTSIEQEIHALFDEILSTRKFGAQTRQDILKVYRNLQMAGIISPKSLESEDDPELDELFESHDSEDNSRDDTDSYHQHQTPVQQEPARTEDSRKIRQTFLKLAEIFHPDKVADSETQMRHTEIMKEVNRAYQDGDLARLLEIEQQYKAGESLDNLSEDDLSRKCQNLEQHNLILKNQYENLKMELRLVKNTPEGTLVSEYRQATRAGIDPLAQMLAQVEQEMQLIEEIRDFVKNFRDKKMTIKDFLRGPACLVSMSQSIQEKILEEMFGIPMANIQF